MNLDKIKEIIALSPLQAKGVYILLGIALIVAITVKVIVQNNSLRMLYPTQQQTPKPINNLDGLPSVRDNQ